MLSEFQCKKCNHDWTEDGDEDTSLCPKCNTLNPVIKKNNNGVALLAKLAGDIRSGKYEESPIDKAVSVFAEMHGIDKDAVKSFANQLLELSKPKTRNPENGGRTTQKALDLRKRFLNSRSFLEKLFTAKELSIVLQAEPVDINNCLRFMESERVVRRAGFKERTVGQRGRDEVLWSLR